jgi:hypothetical protein
MYVCMYAYVCKCIGNWTSVNVQVHTHAYVCMHVCVYIYIYIYIYMHSCIHSRIHMCNFIYICTYTKNAANHAYDELCMCRRQIRMQVQKDLKNIHDWYIRTYIHTQIYTHTYMRRRTSNLYTLANVCLCVKVIHNLYIIYTNTYTYTYMHVGKNIHIYTCRSKSDECKKISDLCSHAHMHTYVHKQIHTNTYIHTGGARIKGQQNFTSKIQTKAAAQIA